MHLHIFYGDVTVPFAELQLMEGLDMGLFSLEEIYSLKLYSKKMGKSFPVPPLLKGFFKDFTEHISLSKLD